MPAGAKGSNVPTLTLPDMDLNMRPWYPYLKGLCVPVATDSPTIPHSREYFMARTLHRMFGLILFGFTVSACSETPTALAPEDLERAQESVSATDFAPLSSQNVMAASSGVPTVICGNLEPLYFPIPFDLISPIEVHLNGCSEKSYAVTIDPQYVVQVNGAPAEGGNRATPLSDDNTISVRFAEKLSYQNIGVTFSSILGFRVLDKDPFAPFHVLNFSPWRYNGGAFSGSITAVNVRRGDTSLCAITARLGDLERETDYYLYYNFDNEVPTLIASGKTTRRGTVSLSGQISKAEYGSQESQRFFVTTAPLYVGTGPFTGATAMRLFDGKLSTNRCN